MDYSLFTETTQPLEAALETLLKNQVIDRVTQNINAMGTFSHGGISPGLFVQAHYVIHADPLRRRVELQCGFVPTIHFLFCVDDFVYEKAGHHTGITTMLRGCSQLVKTLAGDAMLVDPDFNPLLERKHNLVSLHTDAGFWNPFRISQVDLPHRLNQPLEDVGEPSLSRLS